MTTPTPADLATEAIALLAEALDIFHGEYELCDEVSSREWLWRWRTLMLLDAQEPMNDNPPRRSPPQRPPRTVHLRR